MSCDASNIPCRVEELERLLKELQHPPAALAFGGQPHWNTKTQRGTIPLPPDKVEDSWDSEIAGPDTNISTLVDVRQWAGHTPHPLVMSRGVRVSFAARGTGSVRIQIFVNNVQFLAVQHTLSEETTLIPYSAITAALTRIPEGARIEVLISGPDSYSGWKGLMVSFLHNKPLVTATQLPPPGRLPDLGLWVKETSVDPVRDTDGATALASTSWGSGLCFWPARGTFVMLDNAGGVAEINAEGRLLRRTTLSGFGDPEDICCTDSALGKFAICTEAQEIHDIVLPLHDPWTAIVQGGAGWTRTITTAIAAQPNLGLEGITWDAAGSRYVVVNQAQAGGNHGVWAVASAAPHTETLLFRVEHAVLSTYIDGITLTPEGTFLMIGRDSPAEISALSELSFDGRLIQQTTLPGLRYGEGVAVSEDGQRLAVCGETGSGTGPQFFTFTRPQ